MTLSQFHALKLWHSRHAVERPLERNTWDAVLTLWLMGWVGGAASLVLGAPLAELACLALLFLPGSYVTWRTRMHRIGRIRCDWITALR